MEIKLIKSGSGNLILFFSGWGSDFNSVSHIGRDGYDLAVIYDYTSLAEEKYLKGLSSMIDAYGQVELVAWSMGVWAASAVLETLSAGGGNCASERKFRRMVAINGTPVPIDDSYGIPLTIYDGTLENMEKESCGCLSVSASRNLRKFNMRMCGGKDGLETYSRHLPDRPFDNIVGELRSIKENYRECRPLPWNKVVISSSDMIFPTENLKRYWNGRVTEPAVEYIDAPHYPFLYYKTWKQILL